MCHLFRDWRGAERETSSHGAFFLPRRSWDSDAAMPAVFATLAGQHGCNCNLQEQEDGLRRRKRGGEAQALGCCLLVILLGVAGVLALLSTQGRGVRPHLRTALFSSPASELIRSVTRHTSSRRTSSHATLSSARGHSVRDGIALSSSRGCTLTVACVCCMPHDSPF